jgi:hypothetical protein
MVDFTIIIHCRLKDSGYSLIEIITRRVTTTKATLVRVYKTFLNMFIQKFLKQLDTDSIIIF